tara:strand:+ start:88 stop:414 length:327 start_codon:yes stop_codon:yes gene_type:complete
MPKYNLLSVTKLKTGKKKYKAVVFNTETQRENTITFGAKGYGDYPQYVKELGVEEANKKKSAYIARHSKAGEDWTASGVDTAGFWSKHLLWNKPTITASLREIKSKYF